MNSSPAVQINISRTQIIALTVIMLTTTTAATVNIRDTTKMFDRLDMDGNPITNLQDPTSAQHAATKSYVDSNVGGGGITDGSSLNWYKCADSDWDYAECGVSCPSGESLIMAETKERDTSAGTPDWYDDWFTVNTRYMSKAGTEGQGETASEPSGTGTDAYVTVNIACKP